MATTRKGAPADNPEAFQRGAPVDPGTDCAACRAPLPDGHRYVCAACAADSARRGEAILAGLAGHAQATAPSYAVALEGEPEELLECPTCGMALDASGRCAGCVTTVRR